jgi:hypothetical protein
MHSDTDSCDSEPRQDLRSGCTAYIIRRVILKSLKPFPSKYLQESKYNVPCILMYTYRIRITLHLYLGTYTFP